MSEVKGWIERPPCNIVPECGKPGVVVIANKICCADHLIKWHDKQEAKLREQFEGL